MNENAYENAGLLLIRDHLLVVSKFCAPMNEAGYFAGYLIRPLEIIREFCSDSA